MKILEFITQCNEHRKLNGGSVCCLLYDIHRYTYFAEV